MTAVPSFPLDIEIDIVSRLPTKSLVRFASACTSWARMMDFILAAQPVSGANTRILLWPLLPRAMYEHVFLRSLNPETLLKEGDNNYGDATTCVSLPTAENLKSWYLLSSPTENLDSLARQEYYRLRIIGSSNGLICFSIVQPCVIKPTIVWNPLTRSYKKIPPCRFIMDVQWGQQTMYLFHDIDEYEVWGFGYNVSCYDDYKVLARVRSQVSTTRQFQVYSLQANTWRALGSCRFPVCTVETSAQIACVSCTLLEKCHRSAQTALNGALHWLIRNRTEVEPRGLNNIVNGIVAFDLAEEKFWDFPLADRIAQINENVHMSLAILDGQLCAYYSDHVYESSKTEIWVMKEYGVKESWAPWISVALGGNFQPIYMFPNKEILALIDDENDHALVTYNPTHNTYRVIKSLRFGQFCGVVYGESFASASPIGHSELTAAIPRYPQPTSCNSFVTKGPRTHGVITEDDVALFAKFDLPGVDADEVNVRVDHRGRIIHIVAKEGGKDPEFDMGEGKETREYYWGIKVCYGSIMEKVKWRLSNGVLKLVVPKREGAGGWIREGWGDSARNFGVVG